MTREEAKEFYPILQAYAEGKVIECRTKPSAIEGTDVPNDWTGIKEIEFWSNTEYRIKPESKYRPFKDVEECFREMQNHQPFGWMKSRAYLFHLQQIDFNRKDYIKFDGLWQHLNDIFHYYTFIDGTPFGIKVEK